MPTPKPIPTPTEEKLIVAKPEDEKNANAKPGEKIIRVGETPPATKNAAADTILKPEKNISTLPDLDAAKTKSASEEVNSPPKTDESESEKSLFDPIVISVPKPDVEKTDGDKPKTAEIEKTNVEDISKAINAIKPDDKTEANLKRPRIISNGVVSTKSEEETDAVSKCEIVFSQDVISIVNGGGSLGVLVGIEKGKGDPQTIKAKSSSPGDVEAVHEPEIGVLSGKAFFLIKSMLN